MAQQVGEPVAESADEHRVVPPEQQHRDRADPDRRECHLRPEPQGLRRGCPGPYQVQAAIQAVHDDARTAAATDWAQVVALYDQLLQREPSAVVALNRAVAIAMRDGPEAGIAQITPMLSEPPLATYHLTHAAHADLCRRAGRLSEARASYARALELVEQEPERRFLRRRLAQLGS